MSTLVVQDVSSIVQKTVFLKTRFSVLGNSRQVSGTDVLETDADKGLLRVSKQLLNSPQLEAIRKADTQMRTWLYNATHPFDLGVYMLPVARLTEAHNKLTEYSVQRAALVEEFLNAYPALCADAGKHLGSLYDSGDYPKVDIIRGKFVFDYKFRSFAVPDTLKEISAEIWEQEKHKAAAEMSSVVEEITAARRQMLAEMVTHLHEKLTPGDDGKPRILRETAVKNIQEFLQTFDLMNVTDDGELSKVVGELRGLLDGTNAGMLRNSDLFREKIRNGLTGINSQLSELVTIKPGRVFRDE